MSKRLIEALVCFLFTLQNTFDIIITDYIRDIFYGLVINDIKYIAEWRLL